MEYIEAKDSVVIFSKRMGLSTISHKLADLSGEQINGFFLSRKIRLPRKLHAMAMVGALNDRIKELDSHSLSRDAFSKLSFYPNFTEYQLQLLFERIGTEDDFAKYREYLWKLIIRNFEAIHLMDGEAQYLINVRKQKMNDFKTYAKYINQCSMDIENEFDASPLMNLESTLKNSYSQDDIRKLGKKYGIIISNRLKKEELVDYVKMIMKSKKKLTEELEKELDEMTVVQLNSFCTLHQIELSAVLKKNELIYLFLFLLRQTDLDVLPINDLIGYDFAEPLEFSVDLSVVDAFGRGEPNKNVIILPETEDEPEEEPETEDEPEEEPETEEEPEEEPETEEEPEEEPVVEEEPEEEPVVEEEPEEEPVVEEDEQELRAIVQDGKMKYIVIKYSKSFLAKLIQSDAKTKNYYSEIKNCLLSYKGVKSRISWKWETFRLGRKTVAKIRLRGKTLSLVMALDPLAYAESKYIVESVADVAAHADTPLLYRIKNDRRLRYAKELIEQLFQDNNVSIDSKASTTDYVKELPYESTVSLIERNLIKELTDEDASSGTMFKPRKSVSAVEVDNLIKDEVAELLVKELNGVSDKTKTGIINIDTLSECFNDGEIVNLEAIKARIPGFDKKATYLKVLARGTLDKELIVEADAFSIEAVKMIVLTGGKVIKK